MNQSNNSQKRFQPSIKSSIHKPQDDIDDLFVNDNDPESGDMIKQYNQMKKERKMAEGN